MRTCATFDVDRDAVVFLRIPKTGSISFATMFRDTLGPDRWARLPDRRIDAWDMGIQRAHDQLRRFGMQLQTNLQRWTGGIAGKNDPLADAVFLHGHSPVWAPLPTRRRAHYVTLLRDPVDRFLSQYFYIRGKAESRHRGGSAEKRRVLQLEPDDFVDWLLNSPARKRLNGQCLYLASSGTYEDARAAAEDKLLAAAAVSDLGELATVVSRFMGVPEPEERRDNVGHNRPRRNPLGPPTEARLRQALEPDIQLFDFVQANRERLLDTARQHAYRR